MFFMIELLLKYLPGLPFTAMPVHNVRSRAPSPIVVGDVIPALWASQAQQSPSIQSAAEAFDPHSFSLHDWIMREHRTPFHPSEIEAHTSRLAFILPTSTFSLTEPAHA
jgi:hypothetical protein